MPARSGAGGRAHPGAAPRPWPLVTDAARGVARAVATPRTPAGDVRDSGAAVGLAPGRGSVAAGRLRAYCGARSWTLALRDLPRSPRGGRVALGQVLATAERTRARWFVVTADTLALVESDHDAGWRALVDLLDRLGVAVVRVLDS